MSDNKYVIINHIEKNSEAERIGLQNGDEIFEYNSKLINGDMSYFISLTPKTEELKSIELKIMREGELMSLAVKGGRLGISLEVKRLVDNENEENSKYPALRTISFLYYILAILIGVGSIIALIIGMNKLQIGFGDNTTGANLIISSLISGVFGVIVLLAISEIIKLSIDLERNSRKQISLLKELIEKNW